MSFIKITKATHKPSGNTKLYKSTLTAKDAIKQSEDTNFKNWKLETELVWE